MLFCQNCGKSLADQAMFCPNCGQPTRLVPVQPQPQQYVPVQPLPQQYVPVQPQYQPVQNVSGAWYLVPFFFLLLGGIVAYIAVKDRNRGMANNLLIFGIVWSVVAVIFWYVIGYLLLLALFGL